MKPNSRGMYQADIGNPIQRFYLGKDKVEAHFRRQKLGELWRSIIMRAVGVDARGYKRIRIGKQANGQPYPFTMGKIDEEEAIFRRTKLEQLWKVAQPTWDEATILIGKAIAKGLIKELPPEVIKCI